MSFANEKGGYQKTLEVSRENSNRTQTMLQTDFLKKGENYILNITDFVTSTSPPMNLLTGPFLTVQPLGDQNESQDDAFDISNFSLGNDPNDDFTQKVFTPKPYRTWLELARQLEEFFRTLSILKTAQMPVDPNNLRRYRRYAVSYLTQD